MNWIKKAFSAAEEEEAARIAEQEGQREALEAKRKAEQRKREATVQPWWDALQSFLEEMKSAGFKLGHTGVKFGWFRKDSSNRALFCMECWDKGGDARMTWFEHFGANFALETDRISGGDDRREVYLFPLADGFVECCVQSGFGGSKQFSRICKSQDEVKSFLKEQTIDWIKIIVGKEKRQK